MSAKTIFLNQPVYDYLRDVSLRESELMRLLRHETAELEMSMMQIAPEQGQFMTLLVRLLGVRRAIEIGTFTGYSALAIAMGLPEDGCLIACDISDEWTAIGKRYWQLADQADKIDLRLAPAIETLDGLLSNGQAGEFDFVFIDADKENYLNYYGRSLQLLRPGGLILVDNVLWDGSVADPENQKSDTCAIRDFNLFVKSDTRVDISMIPVGDGLSLIRRATPDVR